ncbi:MAG: SUMF1/EgtB/PvdO family nonheme iron enzyme [Gammaproteobacteria bacterium]
MKGREIADKLRAQGDLAGLLSNNQPFTSELLLFIDQFEELFTLCDESHHHRFIELLARAISSPGIQAVLTLRADFYHRCIDYPRLAELLRSGSFPLAAPDLLTLNEMIIGPAAMAGLHFEDGLASRILTDTGQEPGSLPLLAFALESLYQVRTDNALTHTAYEQLGGVQGVIRQRANAVFKKLTQALGEETAEQALRQVFIELVEVNPERGTPTCKRAPLTHFEPTSAASKLIDRFIQARLLVCSGDDRDEAIVEVAHEALLTQWPKLSNWIEECFEDLRIVRQAQFDSQEWERLGKPDSYFWRDERIRSANAVIQRLQLRVSAPLKDFLCTEVEREIERFLKSSPSKPQKPDTDHKIKAKIGDQLAEIGDSRRGVGVNTQGLPDIFWLPVRPGTIILENKRGKFQVEAFHIAKYPVTWIQYRAFIQAIDGYRDKRWWQGLKQFNSTDYLNRIDNNPAENVSWYDAVAYCRWLSEKRGYNIRLLTEQEWQLAASGGDERQFPWGNGWRSKLANTVESGLERTTAVGMYQGGASPVGALDMAGNVWEWCLNQHDEPSITSIDDADSARVLRGGSWGFPLDDARVTSSFKYLPNARSNLMGFRLCRPSPIN